MPGCLLVAAGPGLVNSRVTKGHTAGGAAGGRRKRSPGMNFAFSDEQEELRAAVRRFLRRSHPRQRSAASWTRPRATTPPCGVRWPTSSACSRWRSPRSTAAPGSATSSCSSCSRRWVPPCCARRSSPPWRWAPTRCSPRATTRRRRATARHRLGRDDRHARDHRGQRQVGLRRHQSARRKRRRRLGARRPQDVRASTATSRTSSSWRRGRGGCVASSPSRVTRRA